MEAKQRTENIALADLLIMEKENHDKHLLKYKKQVEAVKLKECTFYPRLKRKSTGTAMKKCNSLYRLSQCNKPIVYLILEVGWNDD